ncbi:hypothetical protein B0J11DRAFT_429538 [Dendryphion nanum]|uniref:DUF4139 domain-containing protein n=1 Tax=Dendryphion nanum TaxID=256645 RepID=A0A9P9IRL1_9PLEO|nr:hypothetical protein B0J11DRAFT_429538 [Dendryphion nanum]
MFGKNVDATDSDIPSDPSKQLFNIKDLTTKSVILYPTRAHVTRSIENVHLNSGSNEVEIYGLSPTVDEHSIQIEGQGAATIADMTVQLVPNREVFESVYPEEDESEDESDVEFHDSDDEDEAVAVLSKELKALRIQYNQAIETEKSATERLSTWDLYRKSAHVEHISVDEVGDLLKKYGEQRLELFKKHSEATEEVAGLKKQIKRKEHEKVVAGKESKKEKEKIEKQKVKERQQRQRQKRERQKEAQYIKQERLRYWPKKVYKVTLLLENSSLDTPESSRRNSIDSITLASPRLAPSKSLDNTPTKIVTSVSLVLSYVTKEAGWSPRYDLRISSLQKTAIIIYRTEFLNRTSETWKDVKLSFSTSQTSYQGLDDTAPFMHAWRIKLSRYESEDVGLLSPEEAEKPRKAWQSSRQQWQQKTSANNQYSNTTSLQRGGLFGSSNVAFGQNSKPAFGSNNNTSGGLFGSSNNNKTASELFGAPAAAGHPAVESQELRKSSSDFLQAQAKSRGRSFFRSKKESNTNDNGESGSIYDPAIEDIPEADTQELDLDFEETSWEDNGLTATYDVPGTRTLEPSSLTRRHKLATLNISNIHLSHICVPKLRSAAFLRAKIRNPSSTVTLLKGSAGVTLDGSFLGNMNIPRVSPGQNFDLSLGVDPGVHVNYPKPSVHRSTQGIIFNKESAQVFSRSIWLNNTKSIPVELLVLDQIPVSEDERLRVGIVTPRGLGKEGDEVKAGVSAKEGGSGGVSVVEKKTEAWGSAKAKLKKNGEVEWKVKLEKGQGALLKLEYEAKLPPGEKIVPA